MFIHILDSHVRSAGKAISWRIVGSIDTFVLTFLITGNVVSAGSVASLESITKIALYYLHERAWLFVPFGHARALGLGPVRDQLPASTDHPSACGDASRAPGAMRHPPYPSLLVELCPSAPTSHAPPPYDKEPRYADIDCD